MDRNPETSEKTVQAKKNNDVKISQTYGSPRWSGEIADCTLPMTLDTYSNCSFGCVYCFSQYQRGTGAGKEDYYAKNVKCINVERVKKIFSLENEKSQFFEWVRAHGDLFSTED